MCLDLFLDTDLECLTAKRMIDIKRRLEAKEKEVQRLKLAMVLAEEQLELVGLTTADLFNAKAVKKNNERLKKLFDLSKEIDVLLDEKPVIIRKEYLP